MACFFLMTGLARGVVNTDLQDCYRQIDEAIDHSPDYVAEYERQIEEKRQQYLRAVTAEDRYQLAFSLYEQYKAFMNDSALAYLDLAEQWAQKQGQQERVGNCRALKAFQCSTVGYYNEALTFLKSIDKQHLDSIGLKNYYLAQMHVHGELGYYSNIRSMQDQYYERRTAYRDSLFAIVTHDSQEYLMNRIYELKDQNRLAEARRLCDRWIRQVKPGSHDYAIVCYYYWLSCDDLDEAKYWLAQSALNDVRNAVMDQASLLMLAERLSVDGDNDRSIRYAQFGKECNLKYCDRLRTYQYGLMVNLLEKNNQDSRSSYVRLAIFASVIIVLLLLVIAKFSGRWRMSSLRK